MFLLDRVRDLLDGKPDGLPFDAVDRTAGGEHGCEGEQEAAAAKHPGSLHEPGMASAVEAS